MEVKTLIRILKFHPKHQIDKVVRGKDGLPTISLQMRWFFFRKGIPVMFGTFGRLLSTLFFTNLEDPVTYWVAPPPDHRDQLLKM